MLFSSAGVHEQPAEFVVMNLLGHSPLFGQATTPPLLSITGVSILATGYAVGAEAPPHTPKDIQIISLVDRARSQDRRTRDAAYRDLYDQVGPTRKALCRKFSNVSTDEAQAAADDALMLAVKEFDPHRGKLFGLYSTILGRRLQTMLGSRFHQDGCRLLATSLDAPYNEYRHDYHDIVVDPNATDPKRNTFDPAEINTLLSLLSRNERKAFWAVTVLGQSYEEIAAKYGWDEKVVDNCIQRSRRKLDKALHQQIKCKPQRSHKPVSNALRAVASDLEYLVIIKRQNGQRYNEIAAALGWLQTQPNRNRLIDAYKRAKRKLASFRPHHVAVMKQSYSAEQLATLMPAEREVMEKRGAGMRDAEIGQRMGRTLSTVRGLARRAKAKLVK